MKLTGKSGDGGPFTYFWQWSSGQGAFSDVADYLRKCPNPLVETYDWPEFKRVGEIWRQSWTFLQSRVEEIMRPPVSKAIVLTSFEYKEVSSPWISLYVAHPNMNALPECCWIVDVDGGGKPPIEQFVRKNSKDRIFMDHMTVKFWEENFARSEQIKKPLPTLPAVSPVPAVTRPRAGAFVQRPAPPS
jgi:hypothetical protein